MSLKLLLKHVKSDVLSLLRFLYPW